MNITKEVIERPSVEATLTHLSGIVLQDGKSVHVIQKPSRAFFRKDGKVTVRSGNVSTTLATFNPITAWNDSGAVVPVLVELSAPSSVQEGTVYRFYDGGVFDWTVSNGQVLVDGRPALTIDLAKFEDKVEQGKLIPVFSI